MSDKFAYHIELRSLPPDRPPELVQTVATSTALEIWLSDGTIVSYPRDPIDIGSLTFSYKAVGAARYYYEYIFDNRQVEMIRVGEFDHQFGSAVLKGPENWLSLHVSWSPTPWEKTVSRSEAAKYTILSDFLPGPLPLHIAGKDCIRDGFELPFRGDNVSERHLMQQIWLQIRTYGNSVDPLVIGPVFKPAPEEKEVRDRIHRCVSEYDLEFLRPLDHDKANLKEIEDAVVPRTDFEGKILDCLKLAIRAMIPHNPAAQQIAKARAARRMRRHLSARGITALEQAQSRLGSLRVAENILKIIGWKTSVARQKPGIDTPQFTSYVGMEEQQDARLVAITRSNVFVAKWKAIAERLSIDEPYYARLRDGIAAALKRLNNRIEALHLAYDLKVSPELCKGELVRRCAANLAEIQAESVMGIHLCGDEVKASLSVENWQLDRQDQYGPTCRGFNCQVGQHQLRAVVWTDSFDESIVDVRLQLVVQATVRHQDGSEYSRMFDGNKLLTLHPE